MSQIAMKLGENKKNVSSLKLGGLLLYSQDIRPSGKIIHEFPKPSNQLFTFDSQLE